MTDEYKYHRSDLMLFMTDQEQVLLLMDLVLYPEITVQVL